jgi:RsmE family RNA methyltransferase
VNLLLLHDEDFLPDGTARFTGRRLQHAREVLDAARGDILRVGRVGGRMGTGEILNLDTHEIRIRVQLDQEPPPRADVDVLLALPRPKALRRVLASIASLGVDRVVLLNSARVEKSYFTSRVLEPEFMQQLLELGLEQARDSVLPQVMVRDRFRPFVEDELDTLFANTEHRWLAHPAAARNISQLPRPGLSTRVVLAIGPEGGWVPFEVQLLQSRGFRSFTLGPRILRVETAVPFLLGQIALARALAGGESTPTREEA